ncbi:MAG: hypothetical protein ACI8RD_001369, partial [Bacillariaceae sp.]
NSDDIQNMLFHPSKEIRNTTNNIVDNIGITNPNNEASKEECGEGEFHGDILYLLLKYF